LATQILDTSKALKRLRLFNEKAEELQSFSFIRKALQEDAGVTVDFDFEKQTAAVNRIGADKEARAAMCSLIRFFLQPRDGIQLEDIVELYQDLPVQDEDKSWVSENLKELDTFLDRPTEMAINKQPPLTHRLIREIFLYGSFVHANDKPHDDKRAVFESWRENKVAFPVLENFFEYAVSQTIRHIFWLALMNVDAISALLHERIAVRAYQLW
jgi:hypothetical protein